ncbi:MAG TPA: hypothetical protein VFM54_02380 [Micromonosporaceae bacterium]|nr:hypothetical protein [Micromonosporaceae bacterium]
MAAPRGRWLFAAAVLLVAGWAWGAAASPSGPAPTGERWVVESSLYNRFSDTHAVICIPASQVERDYSERDRWRDVVVSADLAYAAEPGDPCPAGPIRGSYGVP